MMIIKVKGIRSRNQQRMINLSTNMLSPVHQEWREHKSICPTCEQTIPYNNWLRDEKGLQIKTKDIRLSLDVIYILYIEEEMIPFWIEQWNNRKYGAARTYAALENKIKKAQEKVA